MDRDMFEEVRGGAGNRKGVSETSGSESIEIVWSCRKNG